MLLPPPRRDSRAGARPFGRFPPVGHLACRRRFAACTVSFPRRLYLLVVPGALLSHSAPPVCLFCLPPISSGLSRHRGQGADPPAVEDGAGPRRPGCPHAAAHAEGQEEVRVQVSRQRCQVHRPKHRRGAPPPARCCASHPHLRPRPCASCAAHSSCELRWRGDCCAGQPGSPLHERRLCELFSWTHRADVHPRLSTSRFAPSLPQSRSLSKTCADANITVPQMLGVSKARAQPRRRTRACCKASHPGDAFRTHPTFCALPVHSSHSACACRIHRQAIIENVIFVHQDDANWRVPRSLLLPGAGSPPQAARLTPRFLIPFIPNHL